MTERHDPAPISPSHEDAGSHDRVFRPGSPLGRRIAARRIPTTLGLTLISLAVIGLGYFAADRARLWLHGQSEFLLPFDQIEIRPNPPEAMRGGRAELLRRVQESGKISGPIRRLDQDLSALSTTFALHSPWISRVKRIDRSLPDRLIVEVEYREPIARIEIDRNRSITIAEDCAQIPYEDVEPNVRDALPVLTGLTNIAETRPGLFVGDDGQGKIDARVLAATSMARFLRSEPAATEPITQIDVSQGHDAISLFTRKKFGVYWRNAPGNEVRDEPSAKDKLAILRKWESATKGIDNLEAVIAKIDVSKGRDRVLIQTRRGLWVYWRHLPGEEADGEPSLSEKLAILKQWEQSQGDKPRSRADYLEFSRSGAFLNSERSR